MAKFKWFRFYNEVIDDPKVQRLSPSLFRTWVNLLCVASDGGGKLPSIDDLAFKLRMSVQDVQQHVDDLVLAGLFDILPDGIFPHNWDQRQFTSDSSTERVRKHRRNKEAGDGNVSRAVSETAPDTDSDSEANTEEVSNPPSPKGGDDDGKPVEDFSKMFARPDHSGVIFAAGVLTLVNGTRALWLEQFGNDAQALELALLEIAPEVQLASRVPVPAQVQRRLAGMARERRDRDRRYATAAAKRPSAAAAAPRKRSVMDVIRENPLPEVTQ